MKQLFLIRGCPGSGKTLVANSLFEHRYAADDFFYKNGHYHFDASKLPQAHRLCRDNVEIDMQNGVSQIAVHNTFTQSWEMAEYNVLAKKYGYTTFSIIVEHRHEGKGQHGVPASVEEKMRKRFDIKL